MFNFAKNLLRKQGRNKGHGFCEGEGGEIRTFGHNIDLWLNHLFKLYCFNSIVCKLSFIWYHSYLKNIWSYPMPCICMCIKLVRGMLLNRPAVLKFRICFWMFPIYWKYNSGVKYSSIWIHVYLLSKVPSLLSSVMVASCPMSIMIFINWLKLRIQDYILVLMWKYNISQIPISVSKNACRSFSIVLR